MARRRKSEIEGSKELMKVLRALPENLQKNALASVGRAGAKVVQNAAYAQLASAMKSRPPERDDVIVKKRRSPKGSVAAQYVVGPPKRKYTLRWLHDGTQPHVITARKKVLSDSATIYGRRVSHPGQMAEPWLRRAYFQSRRDVIRAMARQMRKALKAQAKRLVSKQYRGQLLKRIRRNF